MFCLKKPFYANFWKEILSKKRKINEHENVALGDECSTVVLNQLPAKLKDPGSFSIPVALIGPYVILVLVLV